MLKNNEISLEQIKEVLGEAFPKLDEELKEIRSITIWALLKLDEKEWEESMRTYKVLTDNNGLSDEFKEIFDMTQECIKRLKN